MTSARAQIQSANSGVSAGQSSLSGVVQERDVGQATTLDVLNAESDLITSRQTLIQATAGAAIAAFSLVANTGHLTAADLGLGVDDPDRRRLHRQGRGRLGRGTRSRLRRGTAD